jgi:tRNA pseudouridine38-40 synthase
VPSYRIDLGYEGAGFRGYARNAGVRTVQQVLEEALSRVLGVPVDTVVAGRTDAGVHARGQVVSFSLPDPIDADRLQRSITSMLGPEVVATRVLAVPDGFSARFSAMWRRYHYVIDPGPAPDPLHHRHAWHVPDPLRVDRMNRAAAHFLGEQDFASLCRAAEGRSTVRRVLAAGWGDQGRFLVFDVAASSFCHQMVRSMVALSVDVGRDRVDPDAVPEILGARDRNASRGAAPPHGLVLVEVGYSAWGGVGGHSPSSSSG